MNKLHSHKGQQALEYVLLLTTVVLIVLIGFQIYIPQTRESADLYYNKVAAGLLGEPPECTKLLPPAQCPP